MSKFMSRLKGAMVLNPATYEDVEGDRAATGQAVAVVLLSSLGTAVGSRGFAAGGATSLGVIASVAFVALVGWAAWASLTYGIGGHLLPEPQTRVDVGELLRTTGFAAAPGMLRIFGLIPGIALPVFVVTAVWMLIAMIVAVRQALDYRSTARAVAVCGLGWVLTTVMILILGWWYGPALS